jgi:SpoVK/Ycf46/Vps4 family AAA+-type ATPase
MEKNAEFVKSGSRILPKPNGTDYNLINGKAYDLKWDDWSDMAYLAENGELNLPSKIYELNEDKIFKKRVLNNFNNHENSIGVMLAGTKGTGKTMLAKVIAKESNLPIIIVDSLFPTNRLIGFFKQFSTPVCVIFDEIEKNFNTGRMLDFLDGVEKTTKKLVLMTCNELDKVSEYLQDRCSRIRYVRKYGINDNLAFLPMLIENKEIKNAEIVRKFVEKRFKLPSIDNMNAFLNEVKDLEDEDISLDDIVKYMNINTYPPKQSSTESTSEEIETNSDDFNEYNLEEDLKCAA